MNPQAIVALLLSLFASTAYAQGRASYGFVSSEYQSLPALTAALPTLASYKVGLVLAWPSTEVHSTQRLELVRTANAQGVAVHPWILLPEEVGYWANATNAGSYDQAARSLMDAWRAAGLAPSTWSSTWRCRSSAHASSRR
jgi:hypothetical protein